MENNDIIATLENIKNYCENAYDCYACPYDSGICFDITLPRDMTPSQWDLETLKHKLLSGGDHDGN